MREGKRLSVLKLLALLVRAFQPCYLLPQFSGLRLKCFRVLYQLGCGFQQLISLTAKLFGPSLIRHRLSLNTVRFLSRGTRIGFNNDSYLGSVFESGLLAFGVGDDIFDANLSIKGVSAVNADLRLLYFAWKNRLYDLLDGAS